MAKYFKDNNVKKVAAITENTDFAIAFRDALKAEIGDGLMFDEVVEPGTKDFRTLMTRLQKEDFDMFFPNGQTPAAIAAMMQQLREQGMKQPAISHDVADSLDLISIAGDAVNGMRVISVANAGEGQSFEKIFTEKYGTPSQALGYAAQAYDAMGVLGDALASAGADGKAIRDYLYGMKSYKGVIGNFHFDKNGDVVGVPYVLKVVKGGKFVKEKDIAVQ
jgi:branched-chain amino acid transport system substrate-binding protein